MKLIIRVSRIEKYLQPPSGGCVLKHDRDVKEEDKFKAAAFGRLCVETWDGFQRVIKRFIAAAFGRLCVETMERAGH